MGAWYSACATRCRCGAAMRRLPGLERFSALSSLPESRLTAAFSAARCSSSTSKAVNRHGQATQLKWDAASRTLDFFAFADDRRLGVHKRGLFAKMHDKTL